MKKFSKSNATRLDSKQTDAIEHQRHHFEGIAKLYQQSRKNTNHLTFKNLMWQAFLSDKDFQKEELAVLEPMCGDASGKRILTEHLPNIINYTGFDYSEIMITMARRQAPDLTLSVQDITQFECEQKFDLIILLSGLHHVYHHASAILAKLYDMLNPNGYFINLEPTSNLWCLNKARSLIYRKNRLFDAETEQDFSVHELNHLFIVNNFSLVDQIYPGLLAYILYYNPEAFPLLNMGNPWFVRLIFNLEKGFYRSTLGRKLSFATLSLWQKNKPLSKGVESIK